MQRHIFFKQYAGNHGLQYGSLHHEYHGGAHNTIAQDRPAWQAPPTPRRSAIKPPDNFGAFEALGSGMPDDSCKGARWEGNFFLLSQILAASEPWQIPLSKCVNTATHDASSRRSLPCCHCLQQQPLRCTILCTKLAISDITDHMAGCVELLLLQKNNIALIYSKILSVISASWVVIHHRGLEHRTTRFDNGPNPCDNTYRGYHVAGRSNPSA